MDLLANRETPATKSETTQLLITPAIDIEGIIIEPATPAVIQHAVPDTDTTANTTPTQHPRRALLPIPPPTSIRRHDRNRTPTLFYKPHDICAVTAAIRQIMDQDIPPLPIFPTDNDLQPSDTDIMRSYAIDKLFDSAYYTGDTEEIETVDALRAPDQEGDTQPHIGDWNPPATHQDRNRTRRKPGTQTRVEDQNDPEMQA